MRRVLTGVCLLLAVTATACSKPADSPPDQTTAVATQALSVAPTQPAAPPNPAPSATAAPSGIEVRGSEEFRAWTRRALDLISSRAPQEYAQVLASVQVIESVEAGSGMYVQEKRYAVGQVTAYAPGYGPEQQLIWYAGTIVHDSCHSTLFARGEPHAGKDAELTCLEEQKAALQKLDTNPFFANYVQGLIDGADDPANQYWTQPNRHW